MEVLLAKKRLQERLASSNPANKQRITPGCRVIVREERDFANFKTGDEGIVESIDEEAGRCEVRFDGHGRDTTVAARHLCVSGGSKSPRGKSGKYSDTTVDAKQTLPRWRTDKASGSPERSNLISPRAPKVPSTWRNQESGTPLSPGGIAPSETATEVMGDGELWRALQEASSAMEASLRVVESMRIEKADVLGQKSTFIMLKEESFAQWQQAIAAMQSASVHCTKVLSGNQKNVNGSGIQVPVETLGFRPQAMSPRPMAWPFGPPPLSFRAPRAFERSTSAPPGAFFHGVSPFPSAPPSLASPRAPMTLVPGSPGGGAPATQLGIPPAFVPSLPALNEINFSQRSLPHDGYAPRPPVSIVRAATMYVGAMPDQQSMYMSPMQVSSAHGASISAPVTVARYPPQQPMSARALDPGQQLGGHVSDEHRSKASAPRTRSLQAPSSAPQPSPRKPREKNPGDHLSDWFNGHAKALLGHGKEDEE